MRMWTSSCHDCSFSHDLSTPQVAPVCHGVVWLVSIETSKPFVRQIANVSHVRVRLRFEAHSSELRLCCASIVGLGSVFYLFPGALRFSFSIIDVCSPRSYDSQLLIPRNHGWGPQLDPSQTKPKCVCPCARLWRLWVTRSRTSWIFISLLHAKHRPNFVKLYSFFHHIPVECFTSLIQQSGNLQPSIAC